MGGLGADPFMEDFQVPLEEEGGLSLTSAPVLRGFDCDGSVEPGSTWVVQLMPAG